MFLVGFFWGAVVGSLVTQLIIYVAVRRHRAKAGTPSASHNNRRYAILPRCKCGKLMGIVTGGTIDRWYFKCECGKTATMR